MRLVGVNARSRGHPSSRIESFDGRTDIQIAVSVVPEYGKMLFVNM